MYSIVKPRYRLPNRDREAASFIEMLQLTESPARTAVCDGRSFDGGVKRHHDGYSDSYSYKLGMSSYWSFLSAFCPAFASCCKSRGAYCTRGTDFGAPFTETLSEQREALKFTQYSKVWLGSGCAWPRPLIRSLAPRRFLSALSSHPPCQKSSTGNRIVRGLKSRLLG